MAIILGVILGFFYFDETIQQSADFIIGAIVYTETDVTRDVLNCVDSVGLRPGHDEFKSSARMISSPEQRALRAKLGRIIFDAAKIGLVVIPASKRGLLGNESLSALKQIIQNCELVGPHSVFFDEEIRADSKALESFNRDCDNCEVNFGQNSKLVAGIQLADLAAHTLGTMFLEQLGLTSKKVRAGESSGYDPDLEIELGFELWTSIRYSLFMSPNAHGTIDDDQISMATFDVNGYGLYVSPLCSSALARAAEKQFATNYLGCIH